MAGIEVIAVAITYDLPSATESGREAKRRQDRHRQREQGALVQAAIAEFKREHKGKQASTAAAERRAVKKVVAAEQRANTRAIAALERRDLSFGQPHWVEQSSLILLTLPAAEDAEKKQKVARLET